jgi:hypothetical protein
MPHPGVVLEGCVATAVQFVALLAALKARADGKASEGRWNALIVERGWDAWSLKGARRGAKRFAARRIADVVEVS